MKFLPAVKNRYEPFQKITLIVKQFQQSSEKYCKRGVCIKISILRSSQDNPQNNFLNFLTFKNIFVTLQYWGVILGIFLKQTFVKCSSNILETLLRDCWNLPKNQNFLLSNHTLLTQKQLSH